MMKNFSALAAVAAAVVASPAAAAVTVNITQNGPDVVATTTGTFDPTGLTAAGSAAVGAGINPSYALFATGPFISGYNVQFYSGLAGPSSFGAGSITYPQPDATSGDVLYVMGAYGGTIGVLAGNTAATQLSATTTFANTTFASLGLNVGSYVFTAPNDRITINVGVAGVPEPATWAMMLLGFGAIGFVMRRKRSTQALAQPA